MFPNRTTFLLLFFGLATFLILTSSEHPEAANFHTNAELDAFKDASRAPIDSGEYFLGSVRCQGCHGSDSLHIANIDANGNDINLYDDWESTMMALSAKDPFWRAKVSHEILVNPGHANELQTKCTSCHAPMGHFTAMFKGALHYTLDDMLQDTLGLNGVACGGCHEIGKDTLIDLEYSGNIHYDTSRVEYGPFVNPLVGPMELYEGFIPTFSLHMSRSQVCAPCHTLQTSTADLNGNLTGAKFTEQATFHEWLNSDFNDEQPCQGCHMPQIQDPIVIANNILNLPPRSPFNRHKFMGGNSFMLGLIKQNKNALGIEVPDKRFDSTIVSTLDLLQHKTLTMNTKIDSLANDTLYVSVKLTNLSGHKFPSGYPSRRAYVQFAVIDSVDTLFQSGMLRPDFEVTGQGAGVEPHYNVINNPSQVQIYEMAMGDVNSNFTTVLERAAVTLKDNRIPPAGFKTTHYAYDTAKIVGGAETDPNFNRQGNTEGTGKDIVYYRIPLHGAQGHIEVKSAVYYQTLPPRFLTEMFSYNSSFIDSFKAMYQGANKAPVLVASSQADTTFFVSSNTDRLSANSFRVFPIPTETGMISLQHINGYAISKIEIWDGAGRKIKELNYGNGLSVINLSLPETAGVYYLQIESGGQQVVRKVIRK